MLVLAGRKHPFWRPCEINVKRFPAPPHLARLLGKMEDFFKAKSRRRKGTKIPRGFRDVDTSLSLAQCEDRACLSSQELALSVPETQGRASKTLQALPPSKTKNPISPGRRHRAYLSQLVPRAKTKTNSNETKTTLRTQDAKRVSLRFEMGVCIPCTAQGLYIQPRKQHKHVHGGSTTGKSAHASSLSRDTRAVRDLSPARRAPGRRSSEPRVRKSSREQAASEPLARNWRSQSH